MNEVTRKTLPDFQGLPSITFRQLEVFRMVCLEASYANAALELRSTRANIKRVCDDFEKAMGRALFEEHADRTLQPTPFAQDLLGQVSPLSRGLRRLGESVRSQHASGRILRFAAAGEFFKGGLFTDFLARLKITDAFRPCFLRIETKRFRTALLNAECDVYFGVGISPSDRLDLVHLGPIAWKIDGKGKLPTHPADLPAGKWWISEVGETETSAAVIEAFHAAGAKGGRIHTADSGNAPAEDDIVFSLDTAAITFDSADDTWPRFQFSAALRKHHPYSELMPRLTGASIC